MSGKGLALSALALLSSGCASVRDAALAPIDDYGPDFSWARSSERIGDTECPAISGIYSLDARRFGIHRNGRGEIVRRAGGEDFRLSDAWPVSRHPRALEGGGGPVVFHGNDGDEGLVAIAGGAGAFAIVQRDPGRYEVAYGDPGSGRIAKVEFDSTQGDFRCSDGYVVVEDRGTATGWSQGGGAYRMRMSGRVTVSAEGDLLYMAHFEDRSDFPSSLLSGALVSDTLYVYRRTK